MISLNQIIRKDKRSKFNRRRKNKKKPLPGLGGNPHRRAIVVKLMIKSPKKPNSAQRKVAKVMIMTNQKKVDAYIPGEGHTLQNYSTVFIQGGGGTDVPGLHYKLVRGVEDLKGIKGRTTRRSKYGTRQHTTR